MEFVEFPNGDAFWCIKWIDGYHQAHALSRSTSVEILFQELQVTSKYEVGRFRPDRVAAFLRRPRDSSPTYKRARVHVGTLPALRLGQVFQSKELIGTLPTQSQTISLAAGESSGQSVTCGEELPRPEGWTAPFRVLNPVQFDLPKDFSASRCWVYRDERVPADIVIPRTLIEQTFYFPHTAMANAFSLGPWSKTKQELIFFGDLESGLKTQVDPVTREWQIILETKVPDPYAPLMALLHFDLHASRCAEALYSRALEDRGSNRHAPWYASGQIPLPAEHPALRMELRGYWLADVARKGSRTFLATHIAAYDWPAAFPMIAWERLNSGAGSPRPHENDGPRPYSISSSTQRAPAGTQVSAQHDATQQYPALVIEGMNISHLRQPKTRKLKKASHKHYTAPQRQSEDPSDDHCTSTGANSSQSEADRKALIESLLIPGEVHFAHLLTSLSELKANNMIEHYSIFGPSETPMRTDRRGIACWNFLDEVARKAGHAPNRGWVTLNSKGCQGGEGRKDAKAIDPPRIPRAALILEITLNGRVGYWIEIERRRNEAFMSPLLLDIPPGNESLAIDHALQAIVLARGIGLRRTMPIVAADYPPTVAACYQHAYEREKVGESSIITGQKTENLGIFLTSCFEVSAINGDTLYGDYLDDYP